MRRALPALAVAATLLALSPGAEAPFHEPKRWLLVLAAVSGAGLTLPWWRWTALPLVALLTPKVGADVGQAVQALALAWALAAWPALRVELTPFTRVVGVAAALAAAVVLLQALGVDPFGALGPEAGRGRLRLYGTLGNPDFVASALLPVAVLLLHLRGWWRAPLLLVAPALVVTGSLATLGCALVAAAVLALREPRARLRAAAPVLGLAALLLVGVLGRDPGRAARGRAYLVEVALPHLGEAPWLGQGPGVVERRWPEWELAFWQARCPDAACVEAHPQGPFAGRQDHLHADWLEWLLEYGLLGALALGLALGAGVRAAWGRPVVLAALAAALARGAVDFPLHRPADLCLLAALVALAHAPAVEPRPELRTAPPPAPG